jgi:hypothetical protein
VNLLAIAKLQTLNVCTDCVVTLKYGHVQMNHQFVEDDDGNDAFIQYAICTNSIQIVVSNYTLFRRWDRFEFLTTRKSTTKTTKLIM